MNKLESRQKQLQAEKLYLLGMAKDSIAKEIAVNHLTIDRWAKGLQWEERKKVLDEEIRRKVYDNASEIKERQIKIAKAIQGRFVQQLMLEKIDISASDVIKFMQLEKDWIEPRNPIINLQKDIQDNMNFNVHQLVELVKMTKEKRWKNERI